MDGPTVTTLDKIEHCVEEIAGTARDVSNDVIALKQKRCEKKNSGVKDVG